MGSLASLGAVQQLLQAGVSRQRAQTFLRHLEEAKSHRLDPERARADLMAAGYPEAEAAALVEALRQVDTQLALTA